MNKRELYDKIKDLENQIRTIKNTKRNSFSVFADAAIVDVLEKVSDVTTKMDHVVTENKFLKERITELESDHNEMEDRIHYLERKLYSLDMFMVHSSIDKVNNNNNIEGVPHGSETAPYIADNVQPPYRYRPPLSLLDDMQPFDQLIQSTRRNNIEMVRMAGQSLVCKIKKYTIQNGVSITPAVNSATILEVEEKEEIKGIMDLPPEFSSDSFSQSSIDCLEDMVQCQNGFLLDEHLPIGEIIKGSIMNSGNGGNAHITASWNDIEISNSSDEMSSAGSKSESDGSQL